MDISDGGKFAIVIDETIGDQFTSRMYFPDGKAVQTKQVPGGKVMERAYWTKSSLVIEVFGAQTPGNVGPSAATMLDETQRWTLSSDGKTLTREFSHGKAVYIYDKQ